MKKSVLFAIFAAVSLFCNAQFVLSPSAGLITEDGAYTILREGSESENYHAAQKAVQSAISSADIGELEYEKSFIVGGTYKNHGILKGGMVATDWVIPYELKVEAAEGKILISFTSTGNMEVWKKGEVLFIISPTMGKNSYLNDMMGHRNIFNSKGQVSKGCKSMKELYENMANGIVKDIEKNLK